MSPLRPAALRSGDQVRHRHAPDAPPLAFVRRERAERASIFINPRLVGRDGPDDAGYVVVTDASLVSNYRLYEGDDA